MSGARKGSLAFLSPWGGYQGPSLWLSEGSCYLAHLKCPGSFLGASDSIESAYNAGDSGSIPGSGRSLEKGMATRSSILAWEIPWTEEPGRLQSMGLQIVIK